MARRYPIIKDVRGLGLMIGVEIQNQGNPAPGLRDEIVERAFQIGLLLLPCGANTVRFCPPLCLTKRQVEIGLTLFEDALNTLSTTCPGQDGHDEHGNGNSV
jgi:4-aminobutyrate aminotransferase